MGNSDRDKEGREIYVSSMEKSAEDKARIFPYVKEGIIADMGAGAGAVAELLVKNFPESKILAVDNSKDMISRLTKRFQATPQVEVIDANVETFSYPEKIDTAIFISTLHEVFSFNGYSHREVISTIRNVYPLLSPQGRLIIRDGLQPEDETLYLRPRHVQAYERFFKFTHDFKVRPLVFGEGIFHHDSFVQGKAKDFEEFRNGKHLFEMHSQDVSELLSKYFYNEVNWKVELKEQFGIWTLREYQHILLELGFYIIHSESYVLEYLLATHYEKDFELYRLENGQLSQAAYPPSTMILAAEKP